jgi:signal transduction histidine kinase
LFIGLILTLLPIVAVLVVAMSMWSLSEHRIAEAQTLGTARILNNSIGAIMDESQRALTAIANDRSLDWTNRPQVLARLAVYTDRFPFAHGVSWIDPRGTRVSLKPEEAALTVADRTWFQQTLVNRRFTVGEFVVSRLTGLPSIPLAQPVIRGDVPVAILGMAVDLGWFSAQIAKQAGAEGTAVTIGNKQGIVLVRYPVEARFLGKPFPEQLLVQKVLGGTEVAQQFLGLDGIQRLFSMSPLRLNGQIEGFIAVGIPSESVHRETTLAQGLVWGGIALVALVSGLILVFGVQRLVLVPVGRLAASTDLLAQGDFSARINPKNLPEELTLLARSINSMAASLEVRDRELREYQDHLEDMVAARTAEVEASRAELARSNTDLQQFAYVASHDLQEPLRMVASFTQLLERKYRPVLDEQGLKYIDFAVDGARRMQQLINDLLAYSRVETQAQNFVGFEGNQAVDLALKNLRVLVTERQAVVEIGSLPRVWGDSAQLTQVFQNLIANGIKFNRATPPRVVIDGSTDGTTVTITVTDNGIGIDPAVGERIFVLFQRLNTRAEFEGTGIGLAVCKRIVEKHGGKIWLEHPQGPGSRFCFTLQSPK